MTINPGTIVSFQGYYKLSIQGQLLSIGTPKNKITYTINDPENFQLDSTHTSCWGGIKFDNTPSANDTSKIKYSIIQYGKATKASADSIGFWERSGGGLLVRNFSKLIAENNIFQNNLADYGGAISTYYNSSPVLSNNLIIKNFAIFEGGACMFVDGNPIIIGNTIVDNTVLNNGQYVETSGICTLHSKPIYTNNIVFNNTYNPEMVKFCKIYFTYNNNIENFGNFNQINIGNNNTYRNPNLNDDYSLPGNSICVDAGTNLFWERYIPQKDIFGNERIFGESIDMGAIEWNESKLKDNNLANNYKLLQNYPNPFNPTTQIDYELPISGYENAEIIIYNAMGQTIATYSCSSPSLGATNHGSIQFNGSKFNSGIYYYSLVVDGNQLATKKILLVK